MHNLVVSSAVPIDHLSRHDEGAHIESSRLIDMVVERSSQGEAERFQSGP